MSDVDCAGHQIGRDNTSVQQNRQSVEKANEESILKRCADQWNEYRTSSAAEADNWEYNRIQKIDNTKQKKGFFNAKLLVNNVPIKLIIDSSSPSCA